MAEKDGARATKELKADGITPQALLIKTFNHNRGKRTFAAKKDVPSCSGKKHRQKEGESI